MNDRIKLAEAMGWEWCQDVDQPFSEKGQWRNASGAWLARTKKEELPFDPFTDANDDYAVLKWIRQQHFVTYFTAYLENEYTQDYQIGDFARAALKVSDSAE